ncbi:MAG: YggS family pyridoxal phosphate-dependent enzyme [Bacteroidetes bacterium]|nr:YggS family pyridoxal phosphate-dependent enzyme [Bacteroidota bacterium]
MSAYQEILQQLGHTKLIGVSKTKSVEDILALYHEGLKTFGENKVQEVCEKYEQLPKDIEWHLIGHLQSNKVKYIAPFVYMIHSVDSLKLLDEIEKQASKCNRVIKVLLQMHIASEETKFGLNTKELIEILEYYTANPSVYSHIQIAGVMGMATNTDHEETIRKEFQHLKSLFQYAKDTYLLGDKNFTEISMGMSSDYKIAIEEGSTMVRIGSLLFGKR